MWQMDCTCEIESFNVQSVGAKRVLTNAKSSMLWHKRLGHITKEMIIILTKQNLLPQLDFSDFKECIDRFKRKAHQTRKI